MNEPSVQAQPLSHTIRNQVVVHSALANQRKMFNSAKARMINVNDGQSPESYRVERVYSSNLDLLPVSLAQDNGE